MLVNDAPVSKADENFQLHQATIARLKKHQCCKVHSLPDKLVYCWQHKDEPGVCYPITVSNKNFWASCVVSHSQLLLIISYQ